MWMSAMSVVETRGLRIGLGVSGKIPNNNAMAVILVQILHTMRLVFLPQPILDGTLSSFSRFSSL